MLRAPNKQNYSKICTKISSAKRKAFVFSLIFRDLILAKRCSTTFQKNAVIERLLKETLLAWIHGTTTNISTFFYFQSNRVISCLDFGTFQIEKVGPIRTVLYVLRSGKRETFEPIEPELDLTRSILQHLIAFTDHTISTHHRAASSPGKTSRHF